MDQYFEFCNDILVKSLIVEITKGLGEFISIEKETRERTRMNYAQFCVYIDILKET